MAIVKELDADVLHVSSADIAGRVSWEVALDAARESALAAVAGGAQVQRATLGLPGGWMRLMAAAVPSLGLFGYKEFHLTGDGTVRYCIHLFEIGSGRPIGMVDAALVTTLRTAATAAVAVAHLLGTGSAVRLAVVGSGAESLAGVEALSRVLSLDAVTVTSRTPANRESFVASVAERTGLPVRAHDSVPAALEGADLLYVATNSGGKVVLRAADVVGIPVVASLGSTLPSQRELAGEVLLAAGRVVVDTEEVFDESGDALEAIAGGFDRRQAVLLGDELRRDRPAPAGQVLYKSIGSPVQDLVLAAKIIDQARADGFGRTQSPLSAVKVNL